MLCAISGEAPQTPVASRKSGNVFEKRLIETYIQENGKDPVTGEELAEDDLVELRSQRVVKPRPPTLTSIPSLLSVFQNEWDALTLESYTLKQHVNQLRQELSTALYQNDAATRVIARLTKERDEAREALGKLSINESKAVNGHTEAMQVDGTGLPDDIAAKVDATQANLSKTRRKRTVPDDWATPEDIQALDSSQSVQVASPGSRALAVNKSGTNAVIGGSDGECRNYSLAERVAAELPNVNGSVTAALSWDNGGVIKPIIATSTGEVIILNNDGPLAAFATHKGLATGLDLHPCGEILASCGADKTLVLYDLVGLKEISRIVANSGLLCCQFHPDGHIFGVGTSKGQIQIYGVKDGASMATFDLAGPVKSISFSENGTWLAAATEGSNIVSVWDLRKFTEVKSLDLGGKVDVVKWDYTGQYLVGAGPAGLTVQHHDKASKTWSEPLRKAVPATAIEWGPSAKSLVILTTDGGVDILR